MEKSMLERVQEEEAETAFCINDDVDAQRVLRKIAEIKAQCESYIRSYEQRIVQIQKRMENDVAFYESALVDYFGRVEHKKSKSGQSYQLANGQLQLKHQAVEYKRDDALTIRWLRDAFPEHIKVSESVDWAGLKKLTTVVDGYVMVKDTGEIIPGIEAVERPDKFVVSVKEEI